MACPVSGGQSNRKPSAKMAESASSPLDKPVRGAGNTISTLRSRMKRGA